MLPQDSGIMRNIEVQKTNICQICGDKGESKRLVYCVQCKASAEHSYCLEKFRREDDGTIIWNCEDCAPNNPQKRGSEQVRKSERISYAAEAKYYRMKRKKQSVAVRKKNSVRSSEGLHAECLRKNDLEKRKPTLEDDNILNEEPESPKGLLNISSDKQALKHENYVEPEALTSQQLNYPEFDKHIPAHPLRDPVWTGQFRLNKKTNFGVLAYASSKACSKVHSAATALPRLLDVEMSLRCAVWPQTFDIVPPNGDSIGLYFFPQYERDELIFDGVLNDVIERELAVKAVNNNMELLLFSSHLLPPNDRRICEKYYLWGVFKSKSRNEKIQCN